MASLGHSARPGTGGSGWDSHHQAILGAPCPGALCFLSWDPGCLPRLWGPGAGLRERPRADLLDECLPWGWEAASMVSPNDSLR